MKHSLIICCFFITYAFAGPSVCHLSLNRTDITPEIRADFDSLYPQKLAQAQDAIDASGGTLRIGNMSFSSADDYARYAARSEAIGNLSQSRFDQLQDTIRDSWKRFGHTDAQIDEWMGQLGDGISSKRVVWSDGNFRFVDHNGQAFMQNLVPDDVQVALARAQSDIANRAVTTSRAAGVVDSGAQQTIEDITTMTRVRDSLSSQATQQGWGVRQFDGKQAIEIRNIDTSTDVGRRLASEIGYNPNRKVVMSFSDDGRGVKVYIVGADNQQIGGGKYFSAAEFRDLLFP